MYWIQITPFWSYRSFEALYTRATFPHSLGDLGLSVWLTGTSACEMKKLGLNLEPQIARQLRKNKPVRLWLKPFVVVGLLGHFDLKTRWLG